MPGSQCSARGREKTPCWYRSWGSRLHFFQAHGADFELRNLRDRIEGAASEQIRRALFWPVVRHKHRIGPDRAHHLAGQGELPRRLATRTRSPVCTSRRVASSGCISSSGSGYCWTSGPMRRVCVPLRYCDTTRPVVRSTGYGIIDSSAGGR